MRCKRGIQNIYDTEIEAMLKIMFLLCQEQLYIGTAEVRAIFSSGSGQAAGCMVTEGKVVKECGIRVLRNGKIIHTSQLDSLRRVKEEVKEV